MKHGSDEIETLAPENGHGAVAGVGKGVFAHPEMYAANPAI